MYVSKSHLMEDLCALPQSLEEILCRRWTLTVSIICGTTEDYISRGEAPCLEVEGPQFTKDYICQGDCQVSRLGLRPTRMAVQVDVEIVNTYSIGRSLGKL